MPSVSVFPVATTDRGGAPTFADDYNPQGLNGGRKHAGIDIFAAEGTPLYAVDTGTVRQSEEGLGGHVVYLASPDGTTYLYCHLSAFEGASGRSVAAGDVIGYVGHTGNAAHTSPHLHFEVHPSGTHDTVDPYPLVKAAQQNSSVTLQAPPATAPKVARQSTSHSLGAKALAAAYAAKHAGPPSASALLYPLAQAIGEGTFGPTYVHTNNWGSMHATKAFAAAHAHDSGYGMFAALDSSPATNYIARLAVYPSTQLGAAAFLDRVESAVGDLSTVASWADYAARLYATGYFEGNHPDVTPLSGRALALEIDSWTQGDVANIAGYAALLARQASAAQVAIDAMPTETGDPMAITVGPPFASLAHRLTPGKEREPHTLAHAREILGKAATDPPAGAISLADALAAKGGEGVWFFSDVPATSSTSSSSSSTASSSTPAPSSAPSSRSGSASRGLVIVLATAAVGVLAGVAAAAANTNRRHA